MGKFLNPGRLLISLPITARLRLPNDIGGICVDSAAGPCSVSMSLEVFRRVEICFRQRTYLYGGTYTCSANRWTEFACTWTTIAIFEYAERMINFWPKAKVYFSLAS